MRLRGLVWLVRFDYKVNLKCVHCVPLAACALVRPLDAWRGREATLGLRLTMRASYAVVSSAGLLGTRLMRRQRPEGDALCFNQLRVITPEHRCNLPCVSDQ